MDNFLKNNKDFSYYSDNAEGLAQVIPAVDNNKKERKPKAKKRFATAVVCCVLVTALGLGAGVAGTILATNTLVYETNAPTVPQLPVTLSVGEPNTPGFSHEERGLVNNGTLATNDNTAALTPAELYKLVHEGVVGIEITVRVGGRLGTAYEETQLVGTGFVFTTDGYVLTNHHVIDEAISVAVLVNDYEDPSEVHRYDAEVIGADKSTDLAVLKITRDEEFTALPIGDSSTLEVGSFVSAIGYPLGIEKSMTFGIVSGLDRAFDRGGFELNAIQFDAAVNFGNSGGPLFDMYGNVIGVVNKKLVYENFVDNIGLAITINEAKPVINDLLLHGEVRSRPRLGITLVELNEYTAALYGVAATEGIWVTGIDPQTPAFNSGLKVGDVIIEVDGVPVADVLDVQTQIRNNKPGDKVELTVLRFNESGNQRRVNVEVTLADSADME